MEERILEYLTNHPGARKREVASFLEIWLCDSTFLATFFELEMQGLIYAVHVQDNANLEFYDTWYVEDHYIDDDVDETNYDPYMGCDFFEPCDMDW